METFLLLLIFVALLVPSWLARVFIALTWGLVLFFLMGPDKFSFFLLMMAVAIVLTLLARHHDSRRQPGHHTPGQDQSKGKKP